MKLHRRWFLKNSIGIGLSLVGCFVLFSCSENTPTKEVSPAFYYWKTNFQLSSREKKILVANRVKVIYVKFFDVDWDPIAHKPIAKALVTKSSPIPVGTKIIPVVYITNQTLSNLTKQQVLMLAERIAQRVHELQVTTFGLNEPAINELQIDCDWTKSTKRNYFSLLTHLKSKTSSLSATIRLHQIKYSTITGVPPVHRGMLMSYNMADWKLLGNSNSIYDPAVLTKYIDELDRYPLPLDLVMPLFHWGIVYRNNRFLYFINNLSEKDLLGKALPLSSLNNHQFMLLKDTHALGISLRKGDVIKIEEVPFDNLLKGSALLSKKISNQKLTFALYHLDPSSLALYSNEQISQLFQIVK